MDDEHDEDGDFQRQIDDLGSQMSSTRTDIEELTARADVAEIRTDDLDVREQVDREMIAELQAEGVVSKEHALQMEEALRSSRTIGAAMGVIMASRQVNEADAFALLRRASQSSNRKLRELAAEVVQKANAEQNSGP
jgi:hypothetical protein